MVLSIWSRSRDSVFVPGLQGHYPLHHRRLGAEEVGLVVRDLGCFDALMLLPRLGYGIFGFSLTFPRNQSAYAVRF